MRNLFKKIRESGRDENFLSMVENIEVLVSKALSLAMILIIIFAIFDLFFYLLFFLDNHLFTSTIAKFSGRLFQTFGLFLNILIALEILENITAYLRKHVVQVELVIVTSLIAVARKIILLDLKSTTGTHVIGLGFSVLALSISYWIVRKSNRKS
ncbi:MAG: phosphate-starvation-inducible PsiE family protein [Mastigocoleus sp. MO_167.B18]|uniref:phosphate-starvation-inducible PsiE family protein n=1 Tax=Mastigocoleus sp. MO_188.B34 TaxID=3036635 RepID=UPI002603719F|nr:phosphate-starvation-inducible PsiE family protein [Mastigocoleus sp. MO_188.B34]MDJ0698111.1 phosphate-starvation-inducible PsiE family protein [Mastigocoleus sp. MO_188.B34]MDJ0773547.1 phosphate-starvation-inducible PsiE family protein [Mastigocoleus sp. MO_167.B18]